MSKGEKCSNGHCVGEIDAWASIGASDESTQLAVQELLDWAAKPENAVEFANLSGGGIR